MKITLDFLGNVDKANIYLNDLVVFTGESNSGKTYLNYALYALLDERYRFVENGSFIQHLIESLEEKGTKVIFLREMLEDFYPKMERSLEKNFAKAMPRFFSAPKEHFSNLKIKLESDKDELYERLYKKSFISKLEISKSDGLFQIVKEENEDKVSFVLKRDEEIPLRIYMDYIKEVLYKFFFDELNRKCFLLPAERSGLNLFYSELNSQRNSLINHLQKGKINPLELVQDLIVSKYPQPIADYIEFLNDTQHLKKERSELAEISNFLRRKIIGGRYKVDKDGIQFMPYKNRKIKNISQQSSIDLHLASSTAKSIFSLDFYIQHLASIGGYLIIDEPELNLHPDNQRKLARLLAILVNSGVKVILSTHSDYFVKEINNLIMLSEEFPGRDEIMSKYGYNENEILKSCRISPYLVKDGAVKPMEVSVEEGIIASTFDEVINQLNESSDDIYYSKKYSAEA